MTAAGDSRSLPDPPGLALTTRSLHDVATVERRAVELLDQGFTRLVLDPGIREPAFEELLKVLPPRSLAAVALFSPLPAPVRLAPESPPDPCSHDRDEQREAVQRGRVTIEFADRLEIPRVYVPASRAEVPADRELVAELERPRLRPEAWERFWKRRESSAAVRQQLDGLLRVLSDLLEHADRYSVELAIVPDGLPSRLPTPAESEEIRREFSGAPLVTFLDLPGLERACRGGLEGVETWLDPERSNLAGVLLHDGRVFQDHLDLGEGDVDLSRIRDLALGEASGSLEWILDLDAEASPTRSREVFEELFRPPAGSTGSGLLDLPSGSS